MRSPGSRGDCNFQSNTRLITSIASFSLSIKSCANSIISRVPVAVGGGRKTGKYHQTCTCYVPQTNVRNVNLCTTRVECMDNWVSPPHIHQAVANCYAKWPHYIHFNSSLLATQSSTIPYVGVLFLLMESSDFDLNLIA